MTKTKIMIMPEDERERKLKAEREAYEKAHPKPWWCIAVSPNSNRKENKR